MKIWAKTPIYITHPKTWALLAHEKTPLLISISISIKHVSNIAKYYPLIRVANYKHPGLNLASRSWACLFHLTRLRMEKIVVSSRCQLFNNMTNRTSSSYSTRYIMKTHVRYFATYTKYMFLKCLDKYAIFSHDIYVDLKKESKICWCCHFKVAIQLLLSFFDMACNFKTQPTFKRL